MELRQIIHDRRAWAGAALAALAALSFWLMQSTFVNSLLKGGDSGHAADYYLTNFTVTDLDPQGVLRQHLEARALTHYGDDNSTELQAPMLIVYGQNGVVWHVSAEHGSATQGQEQVMLHGEVILQREQADGEKLEVLARDLKLLPKQEYAESTQAVTIRHPHGVTEGVGMQVSLKEDTLRLMSKVRGQYAP